MSWEDIPVVLKLEHIRIPRESLLKQFSESHPTRSSDSVGLNEDPVDAVAPGTKLETASLQFGTQVLAVFINP